MASSPLDTLLEHIHRLAGSASGSQLSDRQLLEQFAERREEAAFAALVRRHGPLVLGVGWRVLRQAQDVEDVFQATFVVLARKAAGVAWKDSVGNWLYEVAYRLAREVRADNARRRAREERACQLPRPEAAPEGEHCERCQVLDEELHRLPAKYRAPLLLCYLEGRTRDEAALQLGCPLGTLKHRLERGRELLRKRLTRRGITLSASLIAVAGMQTVPAALAATTVRDACRLALTSTLPAGLLSSQAATLVVAAMRATAGIKWQVGLALVLTLGIVAAGVGLAAKQAETPPAVEPKPVAAKPSKPAEEKLVRSDRYGDPLPPRALARLGTIRLRHGGTVTCVAFSPDGKTAVSGGWDNRVRFWAVGTGKEVRQVGGHLGVYDSMHWIESLAFSADGALLAVGSGNGDYTIRVYDSGTGKEVRSLRGHHGNIYGVAFLGNRKMLASAGMDGTIRLWDLGTGKELRQIAGKHGPIRCLALTADGKTLATGGDDRLVRLWDAATGKELQEFLGHREIVNTLAFSPDGKTLVSGSHDRTVRFWDVASGRALKDFDGRHVAVGSIVFSPDGKILATGGQDRMICLWDAATGKELRRFQGHQHAITALAFSRDGSMLVSGGWDQTVRLWLVATGKELTPPRGHEHYLSAVAFSPDGQTIATGGDDATLRLWDSLTGKERLNLDNGRYTDFREGNKVISHRDPYPIRDVAFSPDGRLLATASATIQLRDAATGKIQREIENLTEYTEHLAFAPDGRILASSGSEVIHMWDVATNKELHVLKGHSEFVRAFAFSPDGKILASTSQNRTGTIQLWETANGKALRKIQAENDIPQALAFSPDGKTLAAGGGSARVFKLENYVQLWDVATGKEVRRFQGQHGSVSCLRFSPDGRTLAGAAGDRTVCLWEVATGLERLRLKGHRGMIHSLAFAPNGQILASASQDTTALVWDLTGRLREGRLVAAPLSAKDLESLWADLAGIDASKAFGAIWALAGSPAEAVPFLRAHLQPVRTADAQRLARLVADLDSSNFATRQKASEELEKFSELAEPSLRAALVGNTSLEVRRRLEQLLQRVGVPSGDLLRALRALEVLEQLGTPEARRLLQTLAEGAPGARLTRESQAAMKRLAVP